MSEPTPPLDLDAIEERVTALDGLPFDSTWEDAAYLLIRTDVPALVARVRALEAENTLLRRIIHQHGITWFEPATITADDEA